MNTRDTYDAVYARLGCQKNYTDEAILAAIDIDRERQNVTRPSYFEDHITRSLDDLDYLLSSEEHDSIEQVAEAIKQKILDTFQGAYSDRLEGIKAIAKVPLKYSLYLEEEDIIFKVRGIDQVTLEADKEVINRFRKALRYRAVHEERRQDMHQRDINEAIQIISKLDLPQVEKDRLIAQYKIDHGM